LAQSRHFSQALQRLEQRIAQGDAEGLTQLIDQASRARAAWHPSN
jgi:prephenate dehydrogenase